MKISGDHPFAAPVEVVWNALLDPEVLARILPGCRRLEVTGENRYQGAMDIRIGPVQGRFDGTVELTDLVRQESYHLRLDGKGAAGFVTGEGSVRLSSGEEGTTLHYDIEAQVGGRIAGVGQRLLDSSARVISRQSLEGLASHLEAVARAAEAGEAPPEPPPAPSQTEFAARFARGLYEELVPPERRPLVLGAGIAALVLLIVLLLRRCRD